MTLESNIEVFLRAAHNSEPKDKAARIYRLAIRTFGLERQACVSALHRIVDSNSDIGLRIRAQGRLRQLGEWQERRYG